MGIIIKQSLKGSIFSYLGLIVGYINVGIIMPNFFKPDQIGLIQIFAALSLIFSQFSTLGFNSVTNRLFPLFRNKEKFHNGFLFLVLTIGLIGFILSTIGFFIFKPFIIESNIEQSPLLVEYLYLLLPLIFFRLLFSLLDSYNKVLFDAVTGTFWIEPGHKSMNLILIILFALKIINFNGFFLGYIFSLSFPVLPIIFVLIKRGDFNLNANIKFITKPLAKEITSVSAFGFVNSFGGNLTVNLDKILVNHYLSLEQLGIFSVSALFATVIRIPAQAIGKIATGIIAENFNKNDLSNIQSIYYKSSINQSIFGFILFIGLLINVDVIFQILPATYSRGKWVLIIYSFGALINTSNAISSTIISTSKYYKTTTYFLILNILVVLGANMILTPVYGIVGAALATAISLIIASLIRIIFIQIKFKMFCYGYSHLIIIAIGTATLLINKFIPAIGNIWITAGLKSFIAAFFYGSLIWAFKVSEDINSQISKIWQFIFNRNN